MASLMNLGITASVGTPDAGSGGASDLRQSSDALSILNYLDNLIGQGRLKNFETKAELVDAVLHEFNQKQFQLALSGDEKSERFYRARRILATIKGLLDDNRECGFCERANI